MKDYFSWLPAELREELLPQLEAPMPRGRETLSYRAPLRHIDAPEVDGKPHIVFVGYYPYVNLAKKSLALRRNGQFHTTLLACCVREDAEMELFFDQVHELEHYAELYEILTNARPRALNVHIQPSILGAVCLDAVRMQEPLDTRVVLDVYDSQYYMQHDAGSFPCKLERALLRNADAMAHKMPAEAVARIRQEWGLSPQRLPDACVHSLPCRDFFAWEMPPADTWKLVYAGGVMPYHIAMKNGHANQVFDPIIEKTADSGLELCFFVNQNARNMFWEEHERYFAMERGMPHFSFRPGTPFHRLPRAIAGFHYGLLYDNVAISPYRPEAFTYNMSTKIFSYLEAGLPILVYKEFEYIASIVREHGIGLVYDLKRLEELPELLEKADYLELKENVRRFREHDELATLLPVLRRLYRV